MIYELPAHNLYGNKPLLLDFPCTWDVNSYSYAGEKRPALTEEEIRKIILSPVDAPSIREGARGCKDAVIIVDDISRPTVADITARIVIEELLAAGIEKSEIRFVFATGAHRSMMREDYVRKLGEDLVNEYPVYSHNPFYNNVLLGYGFNHTPIELNEDCVNADYKVAIGGIFRHPNSGIGGGGKILLPGIASIESIRRLHLYSGGNWNVDSMMLSMNIEASRMLSLDIKIDSLFNGKGEIAELYCGNCETIIDTHLDEIHAFYAAEKPAPADLVILNNYFKPTEPSVALSDRSV